MDAPEALGLPSRAGEGAPENDILRLRLRLEDGQQPLLSEYRALNEAFRVGRAGKTSAAEKTQAKQALWLVVNASKRA